MVSQVSLKENWEVGGMRETGGYVPINQVGKDQARGKPGAMVRSTEPAQNSIDMVWQPAGSWISG